MTSKGTSRSVFIAAAVSVLALALAPGFASAGTTATGPSLREGLEGPRALRLAQFKPEGGEEISDGGAAVQVKEAGGPKGEADYSGPLGGLGIKCEDQKDLEALALGTYGNLIRAITDGPSVVECAPRSGGGTEGGATSSGSGAPEDKSEKK